MDPLEQAEAVLKATEKDLLAEQIKGHAEMILLTSITNKPLIQGMFLHKAQEQGPDCMSGILLAVGLTAKNWGRLLADDASVDFTKYINPASEALCHDEDGFAHYAVREILMVETVAQADKIRTEIMEKHGPHWNHMGVHIIGLFGELVTGVLDVRNGDYVPGDSNDR